MSRHRAHADTGVVITAVAVVTVSAAAWGALMLWMSSLVG